MSSAPKGVGALALTLAICGVLFACAGCSDSKSESAVELLSRIAKGNDLGKAREASDEFGRRGKQAVPDLAAVLRDCADEDLRFAAIAVIKTLGREGSDAVPQLVDTVRKDQSGMVREVAASALGVVATKTDAVEAALGAALSDPVEGVRARSAMALNQLGSTIEIPSSVQKEADRMRGLENISK